MDTLGATVVVLVLGAIGYVTLRWAALVGRYEWPALEWQESLFRCTITGAGLFVLFRLVVLPLVPRSWPIYFGILLLSVDPVAWIIGRVGAALPFRYAGSLMGTLSLGLLIGWGSRLYWNDERSTRKATLEYGGGLRTFLHDASEENSPIMLSLRCRKVYVGVVLELPSLASPEYVKIFPSVSGFRDSARLEVEFTTWYTSAYRDIEIRMARGESIMAPMEKFVVTLPLDEIVSASRFDQKTFEDYFDRQQEVPMSVRKPQPEPEGGEVMFAD